MTQEQFELAREIYIDLRIIEVKNEKSFEWANRVNPKQHIRNLIEWFFKDEFELYHFAQQDLGNGIFKTEEELIWGDPIWNNFPYAKGDGFLNEIKP